MDEQLLDPIAEGWVANAMMNQALFVIGMPKMDHLMGYRERPCSAVQLDKGLTCENLSESEDFDLRGYDVGASHGVFFLSLFLANVILLNMGVAIIGDTYSYLLEYREMFDQMV